MSCRSLWKDARRGDFPSLSVKSLTLKWPRPRIEGERTHFEFSSKRMGRVGHRTPSLSTRNAEG